MKFARIEEIRAQAEAHRGKAQSAELLIECLDEIQRLQRRRYKHIGPNLSECIVYGEQINVCMDEATAFYDYHQSRGWKMGKAALAPVRDWQAAMRTWMRNHQKWNGAVNGKNGSEPPKGWDAFLKETRYDYEGKFNHAPEYLRLEFATWKKEAGRKKEGALL